MEIEYKGKKLHLGITFRDSGQELLVFLPGAGCLKESFAEAWETEKLQDYSLLSIDFLGHGESSKPQDFSYTMEDHAETVNLLLQQMKQSHICLVAHSMGGAIGLLLADKLGSKLQTFVNVEGNLISEDCGILSRKTISVSYEEFRKVIFGQLQEMMTNSEEKGSHLWVEWSRKTDPYAFYKSAQSLVAWSDSGKLLKIFQSLVVKKAYVYGSKDTASLTKLLHQLENMSSFAIAGSRHFVMNDNPDDFYQTLSEILG